MRARLGAVIVTTMMACGPLVELPSGTSDGSSTGTGTPAVEGGQPTTHGAATTSGPPVTTTEADGPSVDEGPRLDLPVHGDLGTDCVDWPFGGCGMPSPRGVVEGTTPLGEFATTLAVFGSDAGCGGVCLVSANVLQIHLVADPALVPQLEPWSFLDETLVIELDEWGSGGFQGPLGRPVQAKLYASRDGVTVQTNAAEVVMDDLPSGEELSDPFDPATAVVVTGTVVAQDAGWSVAGSFAASFCPDLDQYAICE